MVTFSERLNELCKERKVTQSILANAVGTTRQTIANYQKGKIEPPSDMVIKIAEFFDVPTDYLLGVNNLRTKDIDVIRIIEHTGLTSTAIIELGIMAQNKLDIGILSVLIEKGHVQELVLLLKDAIVTNKQFNALYSELVDDAPMQLAFEHAVQKQALDIYKSAQYAVCDDFSEELEKEANLHRKRLVDAAIEIRKHLDSIIAEGV